MTPEAQRLLAWLREERRQWAMAAGEDELDSFTRLARISRRDQLDTVIARVERDLPEIERQAVVIRERTDDLLAQLIDTVP